MADIELHNPGLIELIRSSFEKNGLPKPYIQEIYLIESHVAGTSHLDLEEIESRLATDSFLIFKREADNKHDEFAIIIQDEANHKLGYVPRDKNEIIANLMDAGKLIFGKLVNKSWKGDWLKLDIKIYMRDF